MREPFTFATWNVRQGNAPERVIGYLKSAEWDILCLQEVRPNLAARLDEQVGWTVIDGNSLIEEGEPLGKFPHGGVIVLRGGWEAETAFLMPGDPYVGRGVVSEVCRDACSLTAMCWHAPHGVGNHRRGESNEDATNRKMAGYRALGACIDSVRGPIVLGFDANMWNLRTVLELEDPPSESSPYYDQHLFFSSGARHRLKDTLLTYLASYPDAHASLVEERPDGPLHVTHRRGGHGPADRFDYVMASEDFEVLGADTDYNYEDGSGPARSDHGFVSTVLRPPPATPKASMEPQNELGEVEAEDPHRYSVTFFEQVPGSDRAGLFVAIDLDAVEVGVDDDLSFLYDDPSQWMYVSEDDPAPEGPTIVYFEVNPDMTRIIGPG